MNSETRALLEALAIGLIVAVVLFFSGCAAPKFVELPNGCYVDSRYHQAVIMAQERTSSWEPKMSKIIGFEWVLGGHHVVHAFEDRGQTWVFDPAQGSIRISRYIRTNPRDIIYLTYPNQATRDWIEL